MTFTRGELALALLLAAGVVLSGVGQVHAKHEARRLFAELEALNREQDRLQVDWRSLQIEQSTWAAHPRIETLARERLELSPPAQRQIVLVAEPPP